MDDEKLHTLLPIGENEKILTTVKHHWFAYLSVYLGAGALCLLILGAIVLISLAQDSLGFSNSAVTAAIILGLMLMGAVVGFSFIPVWLRKHEMLVLTEEALVQIKRPSLFSNKISQLNLQHISDVTVRQDMLGTMFGFAHITIETPGEQDNYSFTMVSSARDKAKAIIEAHENYAAALESGQIKTSLGERPPVPGAAWREAPPAPQGDSPTPPSDASVAQPQQPTPDFQTPPQQPVQAPLPQQPASPYDPPQPPVANDGQDSNQNNFPDSTIPPAPSS